MEELGPRHPQAAGAQASPVEQPHRADLPQVLALLATQGRSDPQRQSGRTPSAPPLHRALCQPADPLLIDGDSGQIIPGIERDEALRIADAAAPQGTRALSATLQSQPSLVYLADFELPAYRVAISDGSDIYISPRTGEVIIRAERIHWFIRAAYFGLHVWRFSLGPGPYYSYLLLLAAGLLLVVASLSGLYLAFAPRGSAACRPTSSLLRKERHASPLVAGLYVTRS